MIGCATDAQQPETKYYRAIAKRDTALLKLSRYEDTFHGQYMVKHGFGDIDSGEIRGKITGDTLIGDYFYMPASGSKQKRIPFALLMEGDKLKLGKGAIASFLAIPYYAPDIPIDYEVQGFIFHETPPHEL